MRGRDSSAMERRMPDYAASVEVKDWVGTCDDSCMDNYLAAPGANRKDLFLARAQEIVRVLLDVFTSRESRK